LSTRKDEDDLSGEGDFQRTFVTMGQWKNKFYAKLFLLICQRVTSEKEEKKTKILARIWSAAVKGVGRLRS